MLIIWIYVYIQDALIDFNNMTAMIIHNKCRGYSEWPGIYSNFLVGTNAIESIKIKLITTHVLQSNSDLLYKDINIDSSTINNQEVKFIKHNKIDMLVIKCADNKLLGYNYYILKKTLLIIH